MQPIAVTPVAVTGNSYSTATGTPWEGVLAVEGVETGDSRQFSVGALTWENPLEVLIPLRWNKEESHGGETRTKAVDVGRILNVWRDEENPAVIRGSGVFDDNGADGSEALRRVREGFLRGISIDPDSIKDADVEMVYAADQSSGFTSDDAFHLPGKHNQAEHGQGSGKSSKLRDAAIKDAKKRGIPVSTPPKGGGRRGPSYAGEPTPDDEPIDIMDMFRPPELTMYHAGRIRGATLVSIPAFTEAMIWLSEEPPETPVVDESVTAAMSTAPWNVGATERQIPDDFKIVSRAYAHATRSGQRTDARFLHHEFADGEVGAPNIAACASALRALNSNRDFGLSIAERRAAYEHIAQHMRSAGRDVDEFKYDVPRGALVSALDGISHPPPEWFAAREPGGYQPIQVGPPHESGWRRFSGHGAAWGTCHTSFPGACVQPPREGEHAYFRLGEVITADGGSVAVGSVTMGTGHAATRGITASQAAEHYDNTGTVVALVASSEGQYGIWLAGAIPPWVDEERIVALQASGQLSGDWRRIGNKLRLVAFLVVNHPGFPVPRLGLGVQRDRQISLVAAGVNHDPDFVPARSTMADFREMQKIQARIGRDPRSRAAEIRRRVKGE